MHGQQRRCQEDPVSLPSGRLEKTTRSSPHHVAQHRQTGSETTPPYAPRSSRFGSEPPSVEDDVDVWRYAILELHARNDACQKSAPERAIWRHTGMHQNVQFQDKNSKSWKCSILMRFLIVPGFGLNPKTKIQFYSSKDPSINPSSMFFTIQCVIFGKN